MCPGKTIKAYPWNNDQKLLNEDRGLQNKTGKVTGGHRLWPQRHTEAHADSQTLPSTQFGPILAMPPFCLMPWKGGFIIQPFPSHRVRRHR